MDESSFGSPSPKVESSLFSSRCIKGWGGSGLWLVRHREQIDYTMSDLIKAAWRNYLLQLQLHPLRTKVSSHSHFLPFKRSFYFRTFFPIMFGCWEKWGDRKGKFELLGMMAVVVLDSLNSWIGWGWVDFEVPFVSSATKQSFALYMYFFFLVEYVKAKSESVLWILMGLMLFSGNYSWGFSWMQRCNRSEDFWDQKASIEKTDSYDGMQISFYFSPSDSLIILVIWYVKFSIWFMFDGWIDTQLYGFAYSGPFGHFLHKLMDIIFRGKKDNTTVAKKVNPFYMDLKALAYKSYGPLMCVSNICLLEKLVCIYFENDRSIVLF